MPTLPSTYPTRISQNEAMLHPTAGLLHASAGLDSRQLNQTHQALTELRLKPNGACPLDPQAAYASAKQTDLGREIATHGVGDLRADPEIYAKDLKVKYQTPFGVPTDQKQSGRCWIFSSLNMMRAAVLDKYGKEFAYSQNFVAYWDKVERANWFLESMMGLAHQPVDSRDLSILRDEAFGDGGEWVYFKNIVKKYGLVPNYAMPETNFSGLSGGYMAKLNELLKEQGTILQQMIQQGVSADKVQEHKGLVLSKVQGILNSYLGAPPANFRWAKEDGKICSMTPLEFAKGNPLDVDDYVEISMLDEEKTGVWLELPQTSNMVGGDHHKAFNLPVKDGMAAVRRAIQAGSPALCMSEVKMLDAEKKLWSMDNDRSDQVFGLDALPQLSKAGKLQAGVTSIAHAMLFVGCDDEDTNRFEGPTDQFRDTDGPLWLVENSWARADKIFMTDSWVKEHVYEAVVPKKFLTDEQQDLVASPLTSSIPLKSWHYMAKV